MHQMFAADLLQAVRRSQKHRNLEVLELELLELFFDFGLGLIECLTYEDYLAIIGAEADRAVGVDRDVALDWILRQIRNLDVKNIERSDPVGWERHHAHGVNKQDIRRLDDVRRQRDLGKLARHLAVHRRLELLAAAAGCQ